MESSAAFKEKRRKYMADRRKRELKGGK